MNEQSGARLAADRVAEFQRLAVEFEKLGGNPAFLRYAWGLALASVPPGEAAADLAKMRVPAFRVKQVEAAAKAAEGLSLSLEALPAVLRSRQAVVRIQNLLPVAARELRAAAAVGRIGPKRPGTPIVTPRRHAFFGAVWPYFECRQAGTHEDRYHWLDQWFAADDKTVPLDPDYMRRALRDRGGPRFDEITPQRFRITPLTGGSRDIRSWWNSARRSRNPFARQNILNGTDAFLLWSRFARRSKARRAAPGVSEDLYVRVAWEFLRDGCGVRDIDDIGGVLRERISTGMFGLSLREQKAALDEALNTRIGS